MNKNKSYQKRKRREKIVQAKLEWRRQRLRLLRMKQRQEEEKQQQLDKEAQQLNRLVKPEVIDEMPAVFDRSRWSVQSNQESVAKGFNKEAWRRV